MGKANEDQSSLNAVLKWARAVIFVSFFYLKEDRYWRDVGARQEANINIVSFIVFRLPLSQITAI